ncbi:MAG: hypothetical protein J6S98_09280 [Lentisphaeria bacterium]|nr:hypothetical protein [Lentisphaeria bacterium]
MKKYIVINLKFVDCRKFFFRGKLCLVEKQRGKCSETVVVSPFLHLLLVPVYAAIAPGSIKQNRLIFAVQGVFLSKKGFQTVEISGKTKAVDVAFPVIVAQWIEPVSHVAVIHLFRINFPFTGNLTQHNKCRLIITVVPYHLQQLFLCK